jgi:hypothetical protein
MRALVWGCLSVAALGCAPSEDEIKREFGEFVARHEHCERDGDCTLISPGCPLGCATALTRDAAAEGERLARELISHYESGGMSCAYDCVITCGAVCQSGKCTVVLPERDAACMP